MVNLTCIFPPTYFEYFTHLDLKNSRKEHYGEVYNGTVLIHDVNIQFYRSAVKKLEQVWSPNCPPNFQKEFLRIDRDPSLTWHNSPIKILQIEKSFLFNKKYLVGENIKNQNGYPQHDKRETSIQEIDDKTVALFHNHWVITFTLNKLEVKEEILQTPLQEGKDYHHLTLNLKGRFISEFDDKEETHIKTEKEFLTIKNYSSDDFCPCMQIPYSKFGDCCKPILFSTSHNFLGIREYNLNTVVQEVASQLGEGTYYSDSSNKRKKEIDAKILRQIRNKSDLKSTLRLITNYPIPKLKEETEEEESEISKLVSKVDEYLHKNASEVVLVVFDRNQVIIKNAVLKKEKITQVREIYLNLIFTDYFDKITRLLKSAILDNSFRQDKFDTFLSKDWRLPSQVQKERIQESFNLIKSDHIEAAVYLLAAQIEPIIRTSVTITSGKNAITKASNKASEYHTLAELLSLIQIKGKESDISGLKIMLKRALTGWGINLRNNLFHGFEEVRYSEKEYLICLYFILLLEEHSDLKQKSTRVVL